jgi:putative ABC transport system permease protein
MFYLRLAWRNLWRNRRRTLITISMVLFAVVLSTSMKSVQKGVYERNINAMVRFSSGYVQVADTAFFDDRTLETSMVFTEDVRRKLRETEGVDYVIPRVETMAWLSADSSGSEALVMGTDWELEDKINGLSNRLTQGGYEPIENGVLLSTGLAKRLKVQVGDTFVLLGMGYQGMTAQAALVVQGTVEMGSPRLNKRLLFMPLPLAQRVYSLGENITSASILISDLQQSESIADALNDVLELPQTAKDWREMIPELAQLAEGDKASGNLMTLFLYIIISFGVFGTILMMLAERKREFGVLTAIGLKRWKLGIVVFLENLFLSFLGAILGMAAAIPVVYWLKVSPISLAGAYKKAYEKLGFEPLLTADFFPEVFVVNGLAVFIIAVLLSLYPLAKLSNLKPIEYLRS